MALGFFCLFSRTCLLAKHPHCGQHPHCGHSYSYTPLSWGPILGCLDVESHTLLYGSFPSVHLSSDILYMFSWIGTPPYLMGPFSWGQSSLHLTLGGEAGKILYSYGPGECLGIGVILSSQASLMSVVLPFCLAGMAWLLKSYKICTQGNWHLWFRAGWTLTV